MKFSILFVGLGALALAACGGEGGSDADAAPDAGADSAEAEATPITGDRLILTVDGGVFDGVTEVAVEQCNLESPGMEIFTVRNVEGNNALMWMFDPQGDGMASFQLVQSQDVFFDNTTQISYTINGNRLTGSGGEMSGDPGKVSVEVICE